MGQRESDISLLIYRLHYIISVKCVLYFYYVRMASYHIILLKRVGREGVNEASTEELDFSFQTTLENE